ncbi:hypothetical protein ACJJTC_008856 [Scirpophaga incertulas]
MLGGLAERLYRERPMKVWMDYLKKHLQENIIIEVAIHSTHTNIRAVTFIINISFLNALPAPCGGYSKPKPEKEKPEKEEPEKEDKKEKKKEKKKLKKDLEKRE